MHIGTISSKENSKVKYATKLMNSARFRREEGRFIAEGLRLCYDAVFYGYELIETFYTEAILKKSPDIMEEIIEKSKASYIVSEDILKKISDTVNPQGVVSICKMPTYELNEDDKGFFIGLENTSNPSNLGAIARTAEAFGIKGIIISSISCDPFSPKSLRAGMGAMLRLPIFICDDFYKTICNLKEKGKTIYSAVVDSGAESISKVSKESNSVLLIGNEANGLSEKIVNASHKAITISMSGRAESLNSSVSAAVLIWVFMRVN